MPFGDIVICDMPDGIFVPMYTFIRFFMFLYAV